MWVALIIVCLFGLTAHCISPVAAGFHQVCHLCHGSDCCSCNLDGRLIYVLRYLFAFLPFLLCFHSASKYLLSYFPCFTWVLMIWLLLLTPCNAICLNEDSTKVALTAFFACEGLESLSLFICTYYIYTLGAEGTLILIKQHLLLADQHGSFIG